MKTLKIFMVKRAYFSSFSQGMSNCYFLRSLFSLRKRSKYENIQNVVKRAHFSWFFPSDVKLLLFEVVIWLVKANWRFLIILLSLKERKNIKSLQKCTLFLQKQSKSLKNLLLSQPTVPSRHNLRPSVTATIWRSTIVDDNNDPWSTFFQFTIVIVDVFERSVIFENNDLW